MCIVSRLMQQDVTHNWPAHPAWSVTNVQPHLSLYPCAPGGLPLPSCRRQRHVRLGCESAIAPAPDLSLKLGTCFPAERSPATLNRGGAASGSKQLTLFVFKQP